jgi:hypothetical protein
MKIYKGKYWYIGFMNLFSKYKKFWFQIWLPVWHKGRGLYITIGIGIITIQRGY